MHLEQGHSVTQRSVTSFTLEEGPLSKGITWLLTEHIKWKKITQQHFKYAFMIGAWFIDQGILLFNTTATVPDRQNGNQFTKVKAISALPVAD